MVDAIGGNNGVFKKKPILSGQSKSVESLKSEKEQIIQSKANAQEKRATVKTQAEPQDNNNVSESVQQLTESLAQAQQSYSEAANNVSTATSNASSASAEAASKAAAAASIQPTIQEQVDTGKKDDNGNPIYETVEKENPEYAAAQQAASEAQAQAEAAQAELQSANEALQSAQAMIEEMQAALAEVQNADDEQGEPTEEENEIQQLDQEIENFNSQIQAINQQIQQAKQYDVGKLEIDESKDVVETKDESGNSVVEAQLKDGGKLTTISNADGTTVQRITKADGSVVSIVKKDGAPAEIHTYASAETASRHEKEQQLKTKNNEKVGNNADKADKSDDAEEKKDADKTDVQQPSQQADEPKKEDCAVDPIGLEKDGAKYDFIIDDGDFSDAKDFLGSEEGLKALADLSNGDNKVSAQELKDSKIAVVVTDKDGNRRKITIDKMMEELGIDDFEIDLSGKTADELKSKTDQAVTVNATKDGKAADGITGYSKWYDSEDKLNEAYDYTIDDKSETTATTHDMSDKTRSKFITQGTSITNGPVSSVNDDTLDTDQYYDNRTNYKDKKAYIDGTTMAVMADIAAYSGVSDITENGLNEYANSTDDSAQVPGSLQSWESLGTAFNTVASNSANGIDTSSIGNLPTKDQYTDDSGNLDEDKYKAALVSYVAQISEQIAQKSWNKNPDDDLISLKGIKSTESSDTASGTDAASGADTATDASSVQAPESLNANPDLYHSFSEKENGDGSTTLSWAGIDFPADFDYSAAELNEIIDGDRPELNAPIELEDGRKYTVKVSKGKVSIEPNLEDGEKQDKNLAISYDFDKNQRTETVYDKNGKVKSHLETTYKNNNKGEVASWKQEERTVHHTDDSYSYKVSGSDDGEKTYEYAIVKDKDGNITKYTDVTGTYTFNDEDKAKLGSEVIDKYKKYNLDSITPSERIALEAQGIPSIDDAIEAINNNTYDDNQYADRLEDYTPFVDSDGKLNVSDSLPKYMSSADFVQMMEYYDMIKASGIDLEPNDQESVDTFERLMKMVFGKQGVDRTGFGSDEFAEISSAMYNVCNNNFLFSSASSSTDSAEQAVTEDPDDETMESSEQSSANSLGNSNVQYSGYKDDIYNRGIDFTIKPDSENGKVTSTNVNTLNTKNLDGTSTAADSTADTSVTQADGSDKGEDILLKPTGQLIGKELEVLANSVGFETDIYVDENGINHIRLAPPAPEDWEKPGDPLPNIIDLTYSEFIDKIYDNSLGIPHDDFWPKLDEQLSTELQNIGFDTSIPSNADWNNMVNSLYNTGSTQYTVDGIMYDIQVDSYGKIKIKQSSQSDDK